MRRPCLLAGPAACLLLVALTLYLRREQLASARLPQSNVPQWLEDEKGPPVPSVSPATSSVSSMATVAPQDGILSRKERLAYINAIMNSGNSGVVNLPLLQCPKHNPNRYLALQATTKESSNGIIQYFFALDLRQNIAILPRLLGSVVKVIRFLGPQHCALSIIEGNSDDGTGEVLAALRPNLEKLGVTYHLRTTTINPKKGDRIAALAELRNLALQPILDANTQTPDSSVHRYTADTTVIFLNDVAACPDDILELLHQRRFLGADMVCGMDWTYVGRDPTFYDVWIARTIRGDSFFDIPPDGNWNSAWNLFWNDAGTQARYNARRPFQVFSCWNGGAVFGAEPLLLGESGVRFRRARQGECHQGEPQLFCKDLWWMGFGKIAVVPTVNLEYSNEAGEKIKKAKGYVSQFVDVAQWVDEEIEWRAEPPEKVKCMAVYSDQFFEAWNKTQPVV